MVGGLAQPAEAVQCIAEIERRLGRVPLQQDGAPQNGFGLRKIALTAERDAEIEGVRHRRGLQSGGSAQELHRLIDLSRFLQRDPQVADCAHMIGLQRDRGLIGDDRAGMISQRLQSDPQRKVRIRRTRICVQGAPVGGRRLGVTVQRLKGLAEAEMVARLFGRQRRGARDEHERRLRVPILKFHEAAAKRGDGMRRHRGQDFLIQPARLGEMACAVPLGRGAEQLIDSGCGHHGHPAGARSPSASISGRR